MKIKRKHLQIYRTEMYDAETDSEFLNLANEYWYADMPSFILEGNYIVIERGIPTEVMLEDLKITMAKIITTEGVIFIYDNLPGLVLEEGVK